MHTLRFGIVAAVLFLASLAPVASAYEVPRNQPLIFAVEITQRFKMSYPWTGDLTITVNNEGIVNGQYRSNSIKPDPFQGKIVHVTGGLSGNSIRIGFGTMGRMSAKGTIEDDKITATFYDASNKTYNFNAIRVTRE